MSIWCTSKSGWFQFIIDFRLMWAARQWLMIWDNVYHAHAEIPIVGELLVSSKLCPNRPRSFHIELAIFMSKCYSFHAVGLPLTVSPFHMSPFLTQFCSSNIPSEDPLRPCFLDSGLPLHWANVWGSRYDQTEWGPVTHKLSSVVSG